MVSAEQSGHVAWSGRRACRQCESMMAVALQKSVVASGCDANAEAVGVSTKWPSLADELALAGRLFGSSGESKVDCWVNEQAALVEDGEFARTFSDHVALPGVASPDYAHRHVRTARGDLLAGIRFYSRNTARPFVDVLAHSFDDIDALTSCVVAEWSNFNVRFLRMRTTPHLLADRPDVILDKSIHLSRCHDMAPADGRVTLDRFDTAEDALHLVADRYAHVAEADPVLSNNLTAAQPDNLRDWHEHEQMWAIRTGNDTVGVFAVAAGALGWITGLEIKEEVISVGHAGKRLAASTQCAWAHGWSADAADLLIGAIDRHNHASRATALRAGRARVLDDIFVAASQTDERAS
ncbi:hypothetical protein ACNO8X_16360 [Mycobacterium sp. PDNC021]|uniref:hypothetical protein n=1 Tax=Mycobacterium sp. PDNC021 TaxID=3391399 RepID=UPI003AAA2298